MSLNHNLIYISGSPRKDSNTDILLKLTMSITGGTFIKLSDFEIKHCTSCWACRKSGSCSIKDDFTNILLPMLINCQGIIFGSPVYFNNVSSFAKVFIDRTWSIKGQLKNKIGGAVVVGRLQGSEGAITAIHAFFTKHEMLIANRGITGMAFDRQQILNDQQALSAAQAMGVRINELLGLLGEA